MAGSAALSASAPHCPHRPRTPRPRPHWTAGPAQVTARDTRPAPAAVTHKTSDQAVNPPEFYQQLAEYNRTNPDQPLYFMQGVELPGEPVTAPFQRALRDTSTAVAGGHGAWDTDANPWLVRDGSGTGTGAVPTATRWRCGTATTTLDIRVPWAMLGFADPSMHQVGVPVKGTLATKVSPGVTVSLTASGTEQAIGQVTWENWNRPGYTERLKRGADQFQDAALSQPAD